MATTRMLLAGFGGQGVLLIGQMIAYSAMYEEKEVTWMPSYGPEMRGGTANCTVVVSDRPIASPLPSSYDVLLAMNKVSLEKYIDQLVPGGDLYYSMRYFIMGDADQFSISFQFMLKEAAAIAGGMILVSFMVQLVLKSKRYFNEIRYDKI